MKTKTSRKTARKVPAVSFVVEDERWRTDPATLKLIRRASRLALSHPPAGARALTVLLSDDRRLRELNRRFRDKDKPTNVLSFASSDPRYWGDVAIAFGVVEREARAQRKTVPAHAAHLTVHGILHLKGYDHPDGPEQAAMESVETLILSRLGLPDPYAPVPIRARQKR